MRIDASLIDPFICTHVIIAFADNSENGTVFISNALGGNLNFNSFRKKLNQVNRFNSKNQKPKYFEGAKSRFETNGDTVQQLPSYFNKCTNRICSKFVKFC